MKLWRVRESCEQHALSLYWLINSFMHSWVGFYTQRRLFLHAVVLKHVKDQKSEWQTSYDASKVKVGWKFKPHSPIWELKMHYCFSLQMSYKNEGRKPVMYIYVRTIFLLVGQVICNPSLTIYTAVVGQSPWHTLHGYAGTCLCGFMYMRMCACAVFLGLRGGRQNDRKEDKLRWPPSSSPLLYLFNLPVWPMGHVFAMLCTWQWERSNKFKLQMLQVEQRLMKELCLCVAWWQMWCVSKEWIQRSLFKDVVWLVSRKNSTCKGASLF